MWLPRFRAGRLRSSPKPASVLDDADEVGPGEVMAIGRTFKESFQKALRGLEVGRFGLGCDKKDLWGTVRQPSVEEIKTQLAVPNAERAWSIRYAFLAGLSVDQIQTLTGIDPWFLANIEELVVFEGELRQVRSVDEASDELLHKAKQNGFCGPSACDAMAFERSRDSSRVSASGYSSCVQAGRYLCRRVRGGDALLLFNL